MVSAQEAIQVGRSMLGVSYSTYDCINFIKAILRKAPGGESRYTVAGTNSLWRSRDLLMKQESLNNPQPGMLAFKVNGEDVHHVGLVTSPSTVIHSSSAKGMVVETDLLNGQWHYLAQHRLISLDSTAIGKEESRVNAENGQTAVVVTENGSLRIRKTPVSGTVIGKVPKGDTVTILEEGEWPRILYQGIIGYVCGTYLAGTGTTGEPVDENADEDGVNMTATTTLVSKDSGFMITLLGSWRVAED